MDRFSARETEWMLELDGIPLAGFWRRAFAFAIDGLLALILLSVVVSAVVTGYMKVTGENPYIATPAKVPRSEADLEKLKPTVEKNSQEFAESRTGRALKLTQEIVIPILYFGVLLWWGNGRTPGKRLMKIRVVSLVHRHLSLWHSVERALGYGAAALEGGFGFVQYFIHPYRRCVQDRIAETIVVTEAGYQAMQKKLEHPLVPDRE